MSERALPYAPCVGAALVSCVTRTATVWFLAPLGMTRGITLRDLIAPRFLDRAYRPIQLVLMLRRCNAPAVLEVPGWRGCSLSYLDRLSNVVRSMAMHRDQHKVVFCSVLEKPAADNLATIVNGDGVRGIQVPVGASRKECS